MADTDEKNADADRSHLDEVLAAAPTPNRATRRKLEALGEAVPVPAVTPPSPDSEDDTPADAKQPSADTVRDADAVQGNAASEEAEPATDPALPSAPSPKRAAPSRKLPIAAAKPAGAPAPIKRPSAAKSATEKPSVSVMQASAPASLQSEPAPANVLADQGPAPKPTHTSVVQAAFSAFSIKDMTMDMSSNFSGFQTAMTEAQAKAKAAFEKSSNALGEMGEFTKGNVEAVIESGKIFAEGCQEIGSTIVAESRTAFETMTGDIKELAAAKSPTDFLKIQGDMVRKSFDSAVAYGSKNSEAWLKLMSDAAAPLSGRMSLAVEKVRQSTAQTMTAPATV
jgi:hypothetical protein